jgi:hypothetical protein
MTIKQALKNRDKTRTEILLLAAKQGKETGGLKRSDQDLAQ